jgi:tripartite-type tricarboxylate transporter receptor subunit TctC
MSQRTIVRTGALALLSLAALAATPASADDFYNGKQLRMIVGSDSGGGYDAYARLIARHWPDFIPGHPTMIVQNMPGAGSLKAMNYIGSGAPADGTVIGAPQNQIPFEPLLKLSGGSMENLQFDALAVNWLGSAAKEVAIAFVWHEAPVRTIEDAMKHEVVTGSSGPTTSSSISARILNATMGTRFKVVYGYKGNADLALAIERGEVQGSAGWFYSSFVATRGQWLTEKKVRILVQIALEKHPALPDVPLILDYVESPEVRKELALALSSGLIGRPYVAPAAVPAARVKVLRASFMDALNSPALHAEAKKMHFEIDAMSGEEMQKLLAEQYQAPKAMVDKVRTLLISEK